MIETLAEGLRLRDLDVGWAVETILHSDTFFSEKNIGNRLLCKVSDIQTPIVRMTSARPFGKHAASTSESTRGMRMEPLVPEFFWENEGMSGDLSPARAIILWTGRFTPSIRRSFMSEWEQIVSRNARDVFRIAFRILGSEHDAEDITQDVFCEAMQRKASQTVSDWGGLLRRMAALRSIDRLRRRRQVVAVAMDMASSVDADPGDQVVASELAERLREAITQLSDQQAAVFSLAYFEARSRDEIAATMEIAPASVSAALYKARQKLKVLLVDTFEEINDD